MNSRFGGIPRAPLRVKSYKESISEAEQLVLNLSNPDWSLRGAAITELSKNKSLLQELAPFIWKSFGTMRFLLDEITSIYPFLQPPNLTRDQSIRVCNVLAIFHVVAAHKDTQKSFLSAQLHIYVYYIILYLPTCGSRAYEYLRLICFGVMGALVKNDDIEIINLLIPTDIIPLCLKTMEMNGTSELTKTVATFIIHKILLTDPGLHYVCYTEFRFFEVARALEKMVVEQPRPTQRLLKYIISCYLRLSEEPRAGQSLRICIPDMLRDKNLVTSCFHNDPTTLLWLQQMLQNIGLCFF